MLPLFISIQRLNQVDSGPNTEKAPGWESQVNRGYDQLVPTSPSGRTSAPCLLPQNSHLTPLGEMTRLVDTGGKKKVHGFGMAGNYQWNLSKSPTLPNTAGKNSHTYAPFSLLWLTLL